MRTDTITMPARDIRRGHTLVELDGSRLPVLGTRTCADGTVRIFTATREARMTGSIGLKVLPCKAH